VEGNGGDRLAKGLSLLAGSEAGEEWSG